MAAGPAGLEKCRKMPEASSNSVHIVIQHVRGEGVDHFRLVAWRGSAGYRPLKFTLREDLVRALHAVVPEFDESRILSGEFAGGETYVAYTGDVVLDDAQLMRLGLVRG
jgi:hypothetical protein